MRTMLISLVFIGSLSQLARSAKIAIGKIGEGSDCEKTFDCFVPEICFNGEPLASSNVRKLSRNRDEINDDCPAIFRHHGYNEHWQYVSIESFVTATQSIKFVNVNNNGEMKAEFSCTKEKNISGHWNAVPDYKGQTKDLKKIEMLGKFVEHKLNGKLEEKLLCTFEVKIKEKDGHKIFWHDEGMIDKVYFEINGSPTVKIKTPGNLDTLHCDPNRIIYNSTVTNRDEVYKKVEYSPEGFKCENKEQQDIYHMQYREYGKQSHISVQELKCRDGNFEIQYEPSRQFIQVDKNDDLDIRCVADAHFFCDTDVKSKGSLKAFQKKPMREPPVRASKKGGIMKCPDGFPYFIIEGAMNNNKIIHMPNFKCKNYGQSQFWIVSGSEIKSERLTEKGPTVYCASEVDCVKRISESALVEAKLDTENLPTCFADGTLYVNAVMEGNKLDSDKPVFCDRKSGKYKYKLPSGTFDIYKNTTFICKYPVIENVEQNQKNDALLKYGTITAVGIAAGTLALAIAIGAFIYTWRMNAARKKARASEEKAWVRYCMDPDEKDAYFKAKNLTARNTESMSAPGEAWNWNAMLTSWQYVSWGTWSKDSATEPAPESFLEARIRIKVEGNTENLSKFVDGTMDKTNASSQINDSEESTYIVDNYGPNILRHWKHKANLEEIKKDEKKKRDWAWQFPLTEQEKEARAKAKAAKEAAKSAAAKANAKYS